MIKFFHNDIVIGWYFFVDGHYLGDGTQIGAYKAKKSYYTKY